MRRRHLCSDSLPLVAVFAAAGGSLRAWSPPFGDSLYVAVLTRTERRLFRLHGGFDVEEVLDGAHWVLGGVLDREFDDIELVTDVAGGPHHPLRCRKGWLAVMPSGWAGAVDVRWFRDGRVVETHHAEDLEEYIDRGWTSYAPIRAD